MNLFLLGAGASYGSGACYPHRPPLGAGLFDELCRFGGLATELSNSWGNLFRENFEVGMLRLYQSDAKGTHRLLRDMARYFIQFEPYEENIYHRLIRFLVRSRKKFVFSTTNYDLLIERTATHIQMRTDYTTGGPRENITVLKIHGSCNFLPSLEKITIRNSAVRGKIKTPPKIVLSTEEVLEFCNTEDSISPAMAIYAPEKPVRVCADFINDTQKIWQQEVRRANRIFVVGLAVNTSDTHIWDHLANAPGNLYYSSFNEKEEFELWKRDVGKENACWLGDEFIKVLPIIEGTIANDF